MRALDRKLFRDLSTLKGQVITIALVVACGISAFVTIQGTYYSIVRARDAYYERYRFPDVFAPLKRAPLSVRDRAQALPGVAIVHTRVVKEVSLPMPTMPEPASGIVIGLPADAEPALSAVMLREGRFPMSNRADEVVVLEAFADAHGIELGSKVPVVLGGIRRDLRVVGTAISPEFVFSISPGELIPNPRRFGVLWMDQEVVAAAVQMRGAFNELQVRLQPGASERKVVDELNRLLTPYGCLGAIGKARQLSNQVLSGDLAQLRTMTTLMPAIFLGVAAFLINVVLSRLVQLQRSQIATLKAVGYRHRDVGLHYLELVAVVVLVGAVIGVTCGIWLGQIMTEAYTQFYFFPDLRYSLDRRVLSVAILASLAAAVVGALSTVRAVMALPPAEAMRPEPPATYKRAWTERLRLSFLFGQAARMVLRELERKPLRAALSVLGIALAVSVLVAGRFAFDSINWYMHVQFEMSERDDIAVTFRKPVDRRSLRELSHLPGVFKAEGLRAVSVRFRNGHRARETVIAGYAPNAELRRVLDRDANVITVPESGILLTKTLGEILGLSPGDLVEIEVLGGETRSYKIRVAGLVDEVFGLFGHMRADALAKMLGDEELVSIALLRVDPRYEGALQKALRERPDVLGVNRHAATIEMFEKQTAGQMRYTTLILTLFASVIACGVIYNNARIALSTRGRDLASLRVLGFRRSEISAILLGELGLQVLLALGPGVYLGRVMAEQMMAQTDPELYRFPVVISAQTYSFAIVVTLAAAIISALLVRRRLDQLDLIGVLKSRE